MEEYELDTWEARKVASRGSVVELNKLLDRSYGPYIF
jgi:hypothetical protein